MRRGWHTAASLVQVIRPSLALAAVSNIWFVVLWQARFEGAGLALRHGAPKAMALTAGVAVGLYVCGVCLNDVLDVRRDRLFAPHRPIPSRRLTATHATIAAMVSLLAALLCATALGRASVVFALACAGAVVAYNALGKGLPAIGLLLLGLIRLMLMASGAPTLEFWWPGWLAMSHVIVIAALVHRLQRKRPYLAPQELWIVAAGWLFVTVGLVYWMAERGGLTPPLVVSPGVGGRTGEPVGAGLWSGPVIAAAGGMVALAATLRWRRSDGWAGQVIGRGGMAWLIVYDGSWFAAAGRWREASVFAALLLLMFAAARLDRPWAADARRAEMYPADRTI